MSLSSINSLSFWSGFYLTAEINPALDSWCSYETGLYSPGGSGTHYIGLAGLDLKSFARIKCVVWATIPGLPGP